MADSQSYHLTLMSVVVFIVEAFNNIPELIVEATDDRIDINKFTIYDLVMGHYAFFNADFSNTEFLNEAKDNSLLKQVYTFCTTNGIATIIKCIENNINIDVNQPISISLYLALLSLNVESAILIAIYNKINTESAKLKFLRIA